MSITLFINFTKTIQSYMKKLVTWYIFVFETKIVFRDLCAIVQTFITQMNNFYIVYMNSLLGNF